MHTFGDILKAHELQDSIVEMLRTFLMSFKLYLTNFVWWQNNSENKMNFNFISLWVQSLMAEPSLQCWILVEWQWNLGRQLGMYSSLFLSALMRLISLWWLSIKTVTLYLTTTYTQSRFLWPVPESVYFTHNTVRLGNQKELIICM